MRTDLGQISIWRPAKFGMGPTCEFVLVSLEVVVGQRSGGATSPGVSPGFLVACLSGDKMISTGWASMSVSMCRDALAGRSLKRKEEERE